MKSLFLKQIILNAMLFLITLIMSSCAKDTALKDQSNQELFQYRESKFPQCMPLSSILIKDRLLARSETNFTRLHQGRYLPEHLHSFPTKEYHEEEWPADMAGRLILTLTLLEQSLKKESPTLKTIIEELPSHFNKHGYMGKVYSPMINEQQLSGHGWLLSGIAEYYLYTGDERIKQILEDVVNNLVLPTVGEHKNYPIDPSKREESGSYMGTHQKNIGNWILSSDVGCNFIFMDGVIKSYEIIGSSELKMIVDEMIQRFLEVDLLEIKAQTHATLTALRSILRYAEVTGNHHLVEEVADRFEIYKIEGMTENYENYNWFGRPLWTEPCAVVDSYITAMNLWRMTGDEKYLEDAQLIYYNGLGFEERYSGAYGSSSCSGADSPFLKLVTHDNHWCCTMRGGVGLVKAAEYSYFTKGDTVFIPSFSNNEALFSFGKNKMEISQKTNYPFEGGTEIQITNSTVSSEIVIAVFVPSWSKNSVLSINGNKQEVVQNNQMLFLSSRFKTGDIVNITFDMDVHTKEPVNRNTLTGYFTINYGPLVLGRIIDPKKNEELQLEKSAEFVPGASDEFISNDSNIVLTPINHLMNPHVRKEYNNSEYIIQLLFRERIE